MNDCDYDYDYDEWELRKMILGGSISQYITVVSELSIPDYIDKDINNINDLSNILNINQEKLLRLLRIGVSLKIFHEMRNSIFVLTNLGKLLRKNSVGSLREYSILKGQDWARKTLTGFNESLKLNKSAFETMHEENLFNYLENNDTSDLYHSSLKNISFYHDESIISSYDFSGFKSIADIGAGAGSLLAKILKENPKIQGVHFDQSSASKMAKKSSEFLGINNRVSFKSGDFFDEIPIVVDTYILKTILHDWNDEKAVKILSNLRKFIPENGKLLIIEIIMDEDEINGSIMDLEMLMFYGGKERTKGDYSRLLSAAGFSITNFYPTKSDVSIIEAIPFQDKNEEG
ncbi:methyltransferase [Exiguobacterium sp. ERU656]|uniref:methyltransferase n=1 Tax=Exiguobacterium sp. ERU656 TaxID=2751217 RepID=UPI001BEB1AAA